MENKKLMQDFFNDILGIYSKVQYVLDYTNDENLIKNLKKFEKSIILMAKIINSKYLK